MKKRWSIEEDSVLEANWVKFTHKELTELLPGRTVCAIGVRLALKGWVQEKTKIDHCSLCGIERKLSAKGLCKPCSDSEYAKDNPEKVKRRQRKYYLNNTNKVISAATTWQKENRDKDRADRKRRRLLNPEKEIIRRKKAKAKLRAHPLYRIKARISEAFRRACKYARIPKTGPTLKLLNISTEEILSHREKFLNSPCVDGRCCAGETIITDKNSQIDHIRPLSECRSVEDVLARNGLENIRWICGPCNGSKGNRE